MSDVRQVQLPNRTGFVRYDLLPSEGGCNILCLSDRQLYALDHMLFPYAYWTTRFVSFVRPGIYQTCPDENLIKEYHDELDDLEDQIGGSSMGCSELASALAALAEALTASAGGSTALTVTCAGGGAPRNTTEGFAQCIDMPTTALLPPGDIVEPSPEGDPPEGFETWEEYEIYKCKAAHWLLDTLINSFRNIGTLNVAVSTVNLLSMSVAGALAALTGILAPPVFLVIVGLLAALDLIASASNTLFRQVADYMAERRGEIICAMYNSGSAADVVTVISGVIDDAIEALSFGPEFEAASAQLGPAMTTIATQVANLGLARSLFEVTADVVYVGADCDPCDPYFGYLLATAATSPYNVLVKGDSVDGDSGEEANGWQVHNPNPRKFTFTTTDAVTSVQLTGEYYHIQVGWNVLGMELRKVSNDQVAASFSIPNSNGGWQTYDNTQSVSLQAATEYYLRADPNGGNSPYVRKIGLVALA